MVVSRLLMGSCVTCVLTILCIKTAGGVTGTDWSRHTVNHVVNTQGAAV